MGLGKQLLVTLVDNGTTALLARYALVSGGKVMSEGECAPRDLPYASEARAVFFSRSGYFDRVEAEVRNVRTLPFQARRIIEGAMAFSEPFKARYASTEIATGQYRLDLAAVADGDIRAALETLPTKTVPFSRLVLAETAIAALVGMETDEPAGVLWMRAGVVIGLLVEKGVVLARAMDRPATGGVDRTQTGMSELGARLERVWGSVASAARRLFPEREVTLSLAFGELVGKAAEADVPSRTLEARLAQRFSGAGENAVLLWPELYGLTAVPACYSLLDPSYQEEAQVSRYATWAGVALLACGVVAAAAASWQYSNWHQAQESFAGRNAKLDADYAAVKKILPSPEQLAALEQRLHKPSTETDFRVDSFLAWVSHITPEGALIRHLGVAGGGAAAGAASAPSGSLVVTIEWEVAGDYASVEKLTADLLVKLGARAQLSNSKLEYKPGGKTKFTTVLAPIAGSFKE
jgi:hypothetical protein